ncbi:hypothetical protein HK100_009995 [Physocladia obscura]|uniref:Cellobiose dehydrogenase-like cytochrome domain-containing protein n=1 Tax=Physocladia obscura TaxID=109957 RepID=A0AAD5T3Y3_9FUNG|nr:hypothetical protein HK100_009995 [Physocladia obscura]
MKSEKLIALLVMFAATALAEVITAATGITYTGQLSADGQSVVFTVTAPVGTTWVGIGFGSGSMASNSSTVLHIAWYTGTQFVISDRYGGGGTANYNSANPDELLLLEGTAVDSSGNWNVVFSRSSQGLSAGFTDNFLYAALTGSGLITSADPSASISIHNLNGRLSGNLIDPAPTTTTTTITAVTTATVDSPIVATTDSQIIVLSPVPAIIATTTVADSAPIPLATQPISSNDIPQFIGSPVEENVLNTSGAYKGSLNDSSIIGLTLILVALSLLL